jgi:hypothetical protein
LPKCERFASSWLPVSGSGSTTSSKKHSGKMLLATEKSSGSHHDAQSPRPQARSSQNQSLDQTADKVQR